MITCANSHCNKPFEVQAANQKYCSDECSRFHIAEAKRHNRLKTLRICKWCHRESLMASTQRFCEVGCSIEFKRKAKQIQVKYEFQHAELFEQLQRLEQMGSSYYFPDEVSTCGLERCGQHIRVLGSEV